LRHPDEDPCLSALFAKVAAVITSFEAAPLAAYGLQPRDAISEDDPRPASAALRTVSRLFGVPFPWLYLRYEQPTPVQVFPARLKGQIGPAFTVGPQLLGDRRPDAELIFQLARKAAFLRPERWLRVVLPDPTALEIVVRAALALAGRRDGARPSVGVERTVEALERHLTPISLDQIAAMGEKIRERTDDVVGTVDRWLRASDLTAARAALALTGDIENAACILARETNDPQDPRLLDLVWSSTTDELHAVRRRIAGSCPA
jgi:hypothetical protein